MCLDNGSNITVLSVGKILFADCSTVKEPHSPSVTCLVLGIYDNTIYA